MNSTYNYVYINIFILAVKIDKLSEHKCLDYLLHTENHGYCLIGKLICKLVFKWKYVGGLFTFLNQDIEKLF